MGAHNLQSVCRPSPSLKRLFQYTSYLFLFLNKNWIQTKIPTDQSAKRRDQEGLRSFPFSRAERAKACGEREAIIECDIIQAHLGDRYQPLPAKTQNTYLRTTTTTMMKNYVMASLLLGSMLAGHAHAQGGCWETDSCYDGYYDPYDLNGQDYYVNDWYVDYDYDGKWVSTDEYYDTYSAHDPQDYADCYVRGTCYDGYYDYNDPNGLDYYVDDWYVDDDFEGYWVSTDAYNDYYGRVHPENYVGRKLALK